jgi:hypothetical protein
LGMRSAGSLTCASSVRLKKKPPFKGGNAMNQSS